MEWHANVLFLSGNSTVSLDMLRRNLLLTFEKQGLKLVGDATFASHVKWVAQGESCESEFKLLLPILIQI